MAAVAENSLEDRPKRVRNPARCEAAYACGSTCESILLPTAIDSIVGVAACRVSCVNLRVVRPTIVCVNVIE